MPDWEVVFDAIATPMVLSDARHAVLRANRAARELAGVRAGQMRDACCEGAAPAAAADCPLVASLRSGATCVRERRGLLGRPGRVWEVASYPLPGGTAVQIFRDVTRARDLQHQRIHSGQLSAAGKLAAGVAHEIRNPLAAMMNAVSLLRSAAEQGSEERDLIEIILEESRRMNRIIGDFLSFARPESRGRAVARIDEVIASTLTLAEKDPRLSRDVELRVELADGLPPVAVDRDRIREVLWNLLLNAVQAVSGGGSVSVSARPRDRDGAAGVAVAVEDSGPGIPAADRERVFAPFETTKPNGTGLGLALARHLVESHGGSIEIGESPLGGARVLFWLASDANEA